MKQFLFIALLAGFTCMSCSDFEYKIENGGTGYASIVITGYRGSETDIIIPEKIKDLPVKRIDEYAFADKGLTSIVIPDSVEIVGNTSFDNNKLTSFVNGNFEYQCDLGLDIDLVFTKFQYVVEGNSITVHSYIGYDRNHIIIPAKIDNLPVTHIADRAFYGKNLSSVVIPDSVTSIGERAFCSNYLTRVTISSNVAHIGEYAFAYNEVTALIIDGIEYSRDDDWDVFSQYINDFEYRIENNNITITKYIGSSEDIIIPERINNLLVTHIGDEAFYGRKLTRVVIPDTVEYLAESAFRRDNTLKTLKTEFSILVYKNEITIIRYNWDKTDISIPAKIDNLPVTRIGDRAFAYNKLTSVVIPESITAIGTGAFAYNKLTSVVIPNNVTSIGDEAFRGNDLTIVSIPDSITRIGTGAFAYNKLTSVVIPNNVTSIGYEAFRGNQIIKIVIPDTVEIIAESAFAENTSEDAETDFSLLVYKNEITITGYNRDKTDVSIPAKIDNLPVTRIGGFAFEYKGLTSVIIPNSVTRIGVAAFSGNDLTSVTIPASVETINAAVFAWNRLTSIVIPDGVTTIGERAFAQNPLTHIVIPNSVTSIEWEAFADSDPSNVVIPESVENYNEYAVFYSHDR